MITFFNTIKYWTQVLNINLFRSCRLRRWACFVPCQCWPTFQSSLRLHLKVKNYCDTNPSLCPILWWIASKHRFPSHYRLWGVEHARDALWCLWSRHRHWWCRGTWRSISWTWRGQFSIKYLCNNINLLVCTASSAKLSHLAVCSDHPPVRSRSEPEGKRKWASNHHEKHLANI